MHTCSEKVDIVHYQVFVNQQAVNIADYVAPDVSMLNAGLADYELNTEVFEGTAVPVHAIDLSTSSLNYTEDDILQAVQARLKAAWLKASNSELQH